MKSYLFPFSILLLFLTMLVFPGPVLKGASDGLLLWFHTVLPTLLPFILVCDLVLHTRAIHWIARIGNRLFSRLFQTSSYGSFAILAGFLCGYPMGAKVTTDLLLSGLISRSEACYLLSFCNNTSPMFVISFLVLQNLKNPSLMIPALVIVILSPILCSFLFRLRYLPRSSAKPSNFQAHGSKSPGALFCQDEDLLDTCITRGIETITKVGGYIMLFSVLTALADTFHIASVPVLSALVPSLEITCGIQQICSLPLSSEQIFIRSLTLTSFGGFCAAFQTRSIIKKGGLPFRPYITEKLITAFVTSFLAFCYLFF